MSNIENLILVGSIYIAGSLMLIGGIITIIHAEIRKNKLLYVFSGNWFLQALAWYLIGTAHLFYSALLMSLAYIPQVTGAFLMFIFLEQTEKEQILASKMVVLTLLGTLYLTFTFLPNSMEIIPGYGVHIIGLCRLFQIFFITYYLFFYLLWSYKIWRKAPPTLKNLAGILLFGSVLFSVVTIVLYMLGTFFMALNALGFIIHSIGALITIIVLRKDTKIIYLLSFKAYRITVFENSSGITLFTYNWAEIEGLDEELFSSLIQAIGIIFKESLKKGVVHDIHLDQAIIIIQHTPNIPISSILVSTKSSKLLRYGLKSFNDQFIERFSSKFNKMHETTQFKDAKDIVRDVFEFIPTKY